MFDHETKNFQQILHLKKAANFKILKKKFKNGIFGPENYFFKKITFKFELLIKFYCNLICHTIFML